MTPALRQVLLGGRRAPTVLSLTDKDANVLVSADQLTATNNNSGNGAICVRSVASVTSVLRYFEVTNVNASSFVMVGIANATASVSSNPENSANAIVTATSDTNIYTNGGSVGAVGATWATAGAGADVAFNPSVPAIWMRNRGGLWNGSGAADPATNTGGISVPFVGPYFVIVSVFNSSTPDKITLNAGALPFLGTPPAGAKVFG